MFTNALLDGLYLNMTDIYQRNFPSTSDGESRPDTIGKI